MPLNDKPAADGEAGAAILAIRKDSATALADTDGDYSFLQVDADGALRTSGTSGGGGGTSMTDDTAFTPGTTMVTPAAGTYRTVRDALDDNDAGAIALSENRGQYVVLENSSATEIGTASDPVRVDPTGTTTQPVSGDATDGSAHGASQTGIRAMGTDGTNDQQISVDSTGAVNINDISGTVSLPTGAATSALQLPDGHNVTVDNAAGASAVNIQDGGNTITVDGTVTADAGAGTFTVTDDGSFTLAANSGVDIGDVTINNAAGASAVNIQDGGNTITVDGTVAVGSSVTPGTGATNLGKAEDALHTTGDVGVMALGVRNNGNSVLSGTNLDYTPIAVNDEGSPRIVGNRASASTDAGNPVKIGGIFNTTQPTFTNGQRGNIQISNRGEVRVAPGVSGFTVDTELPAAAALADNTSNPTVPGVGAFGMMWDGSNWDRVLGNSTAGLIIQGPANEDAAEAGRPVKIGGVYEVTDPTLDDGDIGNIQVNEHGQVKTAVRRLITNLSAAEGVFDNVTTSRTSASVNTEDFRRGILYFEITKSGTPTDILFEIERSHDDTLWYVYRRWHWVNYRFDDTAVGGSGIEESQDIDSLGSYTRLVITATGTNATDTFTTDEVYLEVYD